MTENSQTGCVIAQTGVDRNRRNHYYLRAMWILEEEAREIVVFVKFFRIQNLFKIFYL